MKTIVEIGAKKYQLNLSKPIDISIPLRASKENVSAWYVDPPIIEPVRTESYVGSVKEGGSTNFRNIFFNPHGHGTHTECVGHITEEIHSVNKHVKQYFSLAKLITISPNKSGEDMVIEIDQIPAIENDIESLVIRTLPNSKSNISKQYSNSNPPFIHHLAMKKIRELGIKHILVDKPSVDKEADGGALLSHNEFWNTDGDIRMNCSITEMIYVPDNVQDGIYLLNLQFAPFENDASPSRPLLFELNMIE